MKFFNEALGNRLWGMAFVEWIIMTLNTSYWLPARILSAVVIVYFITFGASRFTGEYKRII